MSRTSGITLAVGVEQSLNLGEDDEQIGVSEHRDLGREPIVVAKAQLFRGDGIVFVDDRQDITGGEEALERVAGVGTTDVAIEIAVGEEKLRDV